MATSTTSAAATLPGVAVLLIAWGKTDRDVERALDDAGQGWARQTWQIIMERVPGPIRVPTGSEIATRVTPRWGYVALPGNGRG